MFNKMAALNSNVKLRPHQERVVNSNSTSQIIAHGVGSGKTLTGLAKFEKMKERGLANKALVVAPAGLRENFGSSGVGKFTNSKYNIVGNSQERAKKQYKGIDPSADYNIMSYEMFRSNPQKAIKETGADTVIFDEAHKMRNEKSLTSQAIRTVRPMYKNHISLTGSIVNNSPSEIYPMIDLATGGKHRLGADRSTFEKTYLKTQSNGTRKKDLVVTGFNHKHRLQKEFGKVIDFVDYDDVKELADMPGKKIRTVHVPMSRLQARTYKKLLNDDPKLKKLIMSRHPENLRKDQVSKAYNSAIHMRRLTNSIGAIYPKYNLTQSAKLTPKTNRLLNDLEKHLNSDPKGQAAVFSQMIDGGMDVLEAGLKARNIPYGKFIGKGNKGVTEATRQADVNDYNASKKRVMLISAAGGEGLSLNDTTWESMLDPHYNPERNHQMEARGVRSGGLKGRKDRNVRINRYVSTMPRTFGIFKSPYKTPDQFIYDIANKKDKQNQLLRDLLKQGTHKAINRQKRQAFFNKLFKRKGVKL